MERRALLVGAIAFPLTSVACLAQSFDQQGWRSFPREVQVLRDSYQGNYPKTIVKYDYFIFQNIVRIDEILRTNGGDVLIVANEVQLNAPIDTRIHFKPGVNYWKSPSGSDLDGPEGRSLKSVLLNRKLELGPGIEAFDALYLWREIYNPVTRSYEFDIAPRPTRPPGEDTSDPGIPQLPSAQVPVASDYTRGAYHEVVPANGDDAPDADVIRERVRSGNITIYADRIRVCVGCEKVARWKPKPPLGDNSDWPGSVFLYAAGLKGGRGAAGSLPACWFNRAGPTGAMFYTTCERLVGKIGGLSGKPGKGGDAGDVDIIFVNRDPTLEEKQQLQEAIKTNPGEPPYTALKRTPNFSTLAATKHRGAFKDEVPIPPLELQRLVGEWGRTTIRSLETDAALNEISAYLSEADLFRNYALNRILKDAQSNPALFSIKPSETFTPFLAQELVRLQKGLVNQVATSLHQPGFMLDQSRFFKNLSCEPENYNSIGSTHREYLAQMCLFRPLLGYDSLRSYLVRTGGLFRHVTDINVGIRHDELMSELGVTNDLLRRLLLEVGDIKLSLYDSATMTHAEKLAQAVKALEDRRRALQAAAEAALRQNNSKTLVDVVRKIGDVGRNFAAAYGGIIAGQWAVAGPALYNGLKGFGELIQNKPYGLNLHDYSDLDEAIKQAAAQLKAFQEEAARIRLEMIGQRNATLRQLVEAKGRVEDRRKNSRFKFASLLRASLQEHFLTGFNQDADLRTNLKLIGDSLQPDAAIFTPLTVQSLGNLNALCTGAPIETPVRLSAATGSLGCVLVDQEEQTKLLRLRDQATGLPLLTVSRGSRSFAVSFGWSVRKEDIETVKFDENISSW